MNDKGLVLLLGTKGGVAGWHLPEGRNTGGYGTPSPKEGDSWRYRVLLQRDA